MQENPYQPPAAVEQDIPDAPASQGWMVDGNQLLVLPSAQLPMVDPYNGKTEERMQLFPVNLTRCPAWIPWTTAISFGLVAVSQVLEALDHNPWLAIPGFLGLVITGIASRFNSSITIQIFCTRWSANRLNVTRWNAWITTILLLLLLLPFPYKQSYPQITWAIGILFLISCLIQVIFLLTLRKLICRHQKPPYFCVRGFHPDALKELTRLGSLKGMSGSPGAPPSSAG